MLKTKLTLFFAFFEITVIKIDKNNFPYLKNYFLVQICACIKLSKNIPAISKRVDDSGNISYAKTPVNVFLKIFLHNNQILLDRLFVNFAGSLDNLGRNYI